MRKSFTAFFFICAVISFSPLSAQESITAVPDAPSQELAFFFGIHNGKNLLAMLQNSELGQALNRLGVDAETTTAAANALTEEETNLWMFLIDLSEFSEPSNTTNEQQAQLRSVLEQSFQSNAYVCGDQSWTVARQAISGLIRDATRDAASDQQPASDDHPSSDSQHLLNLRIPNTLAAFDLTDLEPAKLLLQHWTETLEKEIDEEDTPWTLGRHRVGEDAVVTFSIDLGEGIASLKSDENPTPEEVESQKKLEDALQNRSLHLAIGLIKTRLIFFAGEDLSAIERLATLDTQNGNHLKNFARQDAVMPGPSQTLFATAMVSDDSAKAGYDADEPGGLTKTFQAFSKVAREAKMDGVPLSDIALSMGVPLGTGLGTEISVLTQRWDALAQPPAGWATTFSADRDGIIGRSVLLSVDPRLPKTFLDVDRFADQATIALHARQGTTTADHLLLGFELLSRAYLGFVQMILAFDEDQEMSESGRRNLQRLEQMPLRLNAIVRDKWLPALDDGGLAIVATHHRSEVLQVDPFPVDLTLLCRVSDRAALVTAGDMLRTWANSFVNQYYQLGIDLSDEEMQVPQLAPPLMLNDGDSDVYTLPLPDAPEFFEEAEEIEIAAEDAVNEVLEEVTEEPKHDGIEMDPHWRLDEDILAIGTSRFVTKKMLTPHANELAWRTNVPAEHLRSLTWIDFEKIVEVYRDLVETAEIEEADADGVQAFLDVLKSVQSYRRTVHTLRASP